MGKVRPSTSASNPLEKRARATEEKWKRATAPQGLPARKDDYVSAKEQRARYESDAMSPDSKTRERANRKLTEAREKAREREKFRANRRRPEKHLPTGLTKIAIVKETMVSNDGIARPMVRLAMPEKELDDGEVQPADKPTSYVIVKRRATEVDTEHSEERSALKEEEVERRTARIESISKIFDARIHYGDSALTAAIDAAFVSIARETWISLLLDLLQRARIRIIESGPAQKPARPREATQVFGSRRRPVATTGAQIHHVLTQKADALGFALPRYVDEALVKWALDHLAVGVARGGGSSGRIAASKMREILADPRKCKKHLDAQRA